MDNITHSLVGLAVAETTLQARKSKLRGPLYFASVLSNNLPDLDITYARFVSAPLGYLLHHRGHMHTLLGTIPMGLLLLLGFFLYARQKREAWSAREWGSLAIVVFLGIPIHILLDSLNSYGVHPFWPFHNAWYYLDAIFILEPMFWLALAPALAVAAVHRRTKAVYWIFFATALGLVYIFQLSLWLSKSAICSRRYFSVFPPLSSIHSNVRF